MQSRVECRAESEKTTAERRAEQRREQMSDQSSAETRAALRGEQNRGAKAQRLQRRRGADVQRRKGENRQSFVQKEERENASRNAGGKRSYIGSARARGDRSHAHANRDAHLACV